MKVRLSICVVIYKDYDTTKLLIETLEKYTSVDLSKTIYIVDNGVAVSSPADIESFKEFIRKYQDIVYLGSETNLGFGKGQNKVLNIIDSEYHAIINPDILFCEDSFSKIIDWMDANSDVGMTIPFIADENGNRQDVYRRELTVFDMFNRMFLKGFFHKRAMKHSMQDMDYSKPFQVPFGQGSFLVVRSDLFKSLGGFDENYFMYVEDADLCKRVNQISKLMYFPNTKVIHEWKKESHKDKTLFKYHMDSMKYYFKKCGWKLI